jgi:hypothetical protein
LSTKAFNLIQKIKEIRDGRYSFSPLIGRFCGLEAPQEEIRVRSGWFFRRFLS